MSASLIDNPNALDQYLEMFGEDGPEFVIDIIETYLEDTPKQFDQLDQSMAAEDYATFRRIAHSLKSSSATVGATILADDFAVLEKAGADLNLNSVGSQVEKCKLAFQMLKAELKNNIDSLQS